MRRQRRRLVSKAKVPPSRAQALGHGALERRFRQLAPQLTDRRTATILSRYSDEILRSANVTAS
jgi:hypothetical protein